MSVQQAGLGWEEFTTQLARAIRDFRIENSSSSRTERLTPMCSSPPTTTQSQRSAPVTAINNSLTLPTTTVSNCSHNQVGRFSPMPSRTGRLASTFRQSQQGSTISRTAVSSRCAMCTEPRPPSNSATPHGVSRKSCTQAGPTPTGRSLPSMRCRTPCRSRASPSR